MRRICILENDTISQRIVPGLPRFATLYERLLREGGGGDWSFEAFHVPAGEYPASFDGFDAVVLTGSRHDAFGDEPWIADLRARVRALVDARRKVVGICFGHQLVAHCLGAPVGRAPGGWHAGRFDYDWHGPVAGAGALPPRLGLHAVHQDQVLALPEGARLLASSPTCPVAAFALGDHVLSMQQHPEFDGGIVANLLELLRPALGEDAYATGRRSLAPSHDGARLGVAIASFVAATG
jgi:GMP synthase-like glutamine amidotransferase